MKKQDSFIFLFIIIGIFFIVYKKRNRQVIRDIDRCMAVVCGGFDATGKTGCPEGCRCGDPPPKLPDAKRNCVPI